MSYYIMGFEGPQLQLIFHKKGSLWGGAPKVNTQFLCMMHV